MGARLALIAAFLVVGHALVPSSATGVGLDVVTQTAMRFDANGAPFDRLGWSVGVSGSTAVVGSPQGKAFVLTRDGSTWSEPVALQPTNPPADFGAVVAISGDTIVVGGSGNVHVFRQNGATWPQEAVLPGSGTFGRAVDISGDTIIIGDPWTNKGQGAVFISDRTGSSWSTPQKLAAVDHNPDSYRGDHFGYAVAISGDTALIGAPTDDSSPRGYGNEEGSAFVYVRTAGTWSEQSFLTVDDFFFFFGFAVAISGDTAVIGSSTNGGLAFAFTRVGATWSAPFELRPNPGEAFTGDFYGQTLAIAGDRIVVGAFGVDKDQGAAFVFEREDAGWVERQRLLADPRPPVKTDGTGRGESNFAASLAASGNTIIVGATTTRIGGNENQGAVYFFQSLDSDGDALPDDWETNGVTSDGHFIDLPAMGADPQHKDVFLHVDWMAPGPQNHHHEPDPRAIRMVIDSFATAPVANPDGRTGINLHVDAGPLSIMKYVTGGSQTWGVLSRAGEVPFQAIVDTAIPSTIVTSKAALVPIQLAHFTPAGRASVFHYVLYCEDIDNTKPHGASGGDPAAADFFVARSTIGRPLVEASTFMHELGHNLGLSHGGGHGDQAEVNRKPNHISIMNYRFDTVGTLRPDGRQRSLDFSRSELPTLDENNLDEFVGINDPIGHLTTWNRLTRGIFPAGTNKCLEDDQYFRRFYPTDALDWDCDGQKSFSPVAADINGDGRCVGSGNDSHLDSSPGGDDVVIGLLISSGPNHKCESTAVGDDDQIQELNRTQSQLLKGFNDWANPPTGLIYDGGGPIGTLDKGRARSAVTAADAVGGGSKPPEVPIEEIMADVPAVLLDEELLAPLEDVSFAPQAGGPPLQVQFDGSGSMAINGTIASWAWDFGDGATGTGVTTTHTYTAVGEYFASLTVTDSGGHVNLLPLLHRVQVVAGGATPPPPIKTATPAQTVAPVTPTPTRTPTRTPTVTPTPGAKLVVTTSADNGSDANPLAGSLRQAIVTANSLANLGGVPDVISFDIPGPGVHTIAPTAFVPRITDPVTIDGYTQPGASPNTLAVGNDAVILIELDLENVLPGAGGNSIGFDLRGVGGSTVRGIAINRYQSGGVSLFSGDNVIEGCFIGVNAAGDARLIPAGTNGAGVAGIFVAQGANNRIGGPLPAARNVIVGNGEFGGVNVGNDFLAGVSNTRIQGNYIGTNAAGSLALHTGDSSGPGVAVGGAKTTNTTIGGTEAGAGNVISGNGLGNGNGFGIYVGTTNDVTIQGNLIGTNAAGMAAVGNPSGGIVAEGTVGHLLIGGAVAGARNVISGNGRDGLNGRGFPSEGIALAAAAPDGITVQGNFVGTGIDGVTPLPNRIDGIGFGNGPVAGTTYAIGGTNPGEGNVIAGNAAHGIQVGNPFTSTGPVTILGNSMFANGGLSIFGGGLGIDLQGSPQNAFQVTANDPCDGDAGPNGLQNSPDLVQADNFSGAVTMIGSLNSKANQVFRVEFFSSPACDASGHGEGRTFVGAKTVATAADCVASIDVTFQPAVAIGQFITATATAADGSTSEFSGCVPVTGPLLVTTPTPTGATPTVTPMSTGATSTSSLGATPAATPTPTGPAPTRTPAPENCYDCIDNDNDGTIDRDDAERPARADGMGLGLGRPGKTAKAIAKCAKTLGQAGFKFSAAKMKRLQKCASAAFVCVQLKANNPTCLAKAKASCAKELAKGSADQGKLQKAVAKACAAPAVDVGDLKSLAGIGYDSEGAVCGERGVGTLASADDVASCLVAEHTCRAEDLVASEIPRAAELLELAGRDPATEFPCLTAGVNSGGEALAAPIAKLAVKCQKAIAKAGAKFAAGKAKLTQKCLNVVYACVQVKASDAKCAPKAAAKCQKQLAKLTAANGVSAKLAAAIAKGCTKAPFALDDVLAQGGLGFTALGNECDALGVPALASLVDVSTCLERRHDCRVDQMLETETPRLEELLGIGRGAQQ